MSLIARGRRAQWEGRELTATVIALQERREMTEEEQVHAIEVFGYTTAEGRFLRLVALHGGYFLRRQILHSKHGLIMAAQDFIEKLIDRRHASLEIRRDDQDLYRLHFKPIYAAIGQAKSRNRRDHRPATIRVRLMALDFVLEHPECELLTTEEEKLAYLIDTRRIDPGVVPVRSFCIKRRLRPATSPMDSPCFEG